MLRVVILAFFCSLPLLSAEAQKDRTLVFLHNKVDKPPLTEAQVDELMKGHLANIERLAKEGKILSAGPFEGGGGIFIMSTGSISEAREWLATDPGVQAQRWNIEMQPFSVAEGGICTPSEPYEMVTYNLVRFEQHNEIANYKVSSVKETKMTTLSTIQELKAQDKLLLVCDFGQGKGGVFLYQGQDQSDIIQKDEAVVNGEVDVSFKQLWIAKGSFCED